MSLREPEPAATGNHVAELNPFCGGVDEAATTGRVALPVTMGNTVREGTYCITSVRLYTAAEMANRPIRAVGF